jgi:polyisoprenoid-binding protein YceI
MKKCIVLLLFAFTLTSAGLPMQNTYFLSKNYMVTIHGTSTIHNWKDSVGTVTGDMVADLNQDGTVDVQAIHIKMEVRSIKSDMGSGMDNKTYAALKADANPEIIFLLDVPVKLTQVNPGGHTLSIKGSLTLAGVHRAVIMQVNSFTLGQGKLRFEGSQAINMTDYGVKPPSALFGTIKARPEISIQFKTNFLLINKSNYETYH